MKKISLLIAFSLFSLSFCFAAVPDWVHSYGVNNPYRGDGYLTGFGVASQGEKNSQSAAKDQAMADLGKKIKVEVHSELVSQQSEVDGEFRSALSSITRSTMNLSISGVEFHVYEDRDNSYVLAYIARSVLLKQFRDNSQKLWSRILSNHKEAKMLIDNTRSGQALEKLYRASLSFFELYEQYSLYNTISSVGSDSIFVQLMGVESLSDLQSMESEIEHLKERLEKSRCSSLNEGIQKLAVILQMQGVDGDNLQILPLTYESTSFSSPFGRYAGERLKAAFSGESPANTEKLIVQGQYWAEGDDLRLILIVKDPEGIKRGRAEVLIPKKDTMGRSYKPQNFNEAMTAMREFAEGALVEGGINLDVWTNKGNSDDSLVFTEGETLQLYFRVNQPAFLQITYKLATGENVLLERMFYIGIDKVNRAVALPYEFEVQPPFGVEQLLVTAYSTEPPTPQTRTASIGGENYEVFGSVKEVVAKARGLGKKKKSGRPRVGEAMLTLTTMEN